MHTLLKWQLLILWVFLPYLSFSQTDTANICFPKPVAEKIAKDLLTGDNCLTNFRLINANLSICEMQLHQYDSVVKDKDKIISKYLIINGADSMKYKVMDDQYKILSKHYKRLKIVNTIKTVTGAITAGAFIISLYYKK